MTYNASGTYYDTIPNAAGCDSLMTLNLTIRNNSSSIATADVCQSYTWRGMTYNASGTYYDTIPNAAGCDSLMTLNLTIDSVDLSISQAGFVLTSNQLGANYQWIDCSSNTAIVGANSQSYTVIANGDYSVEVTYNSCRDTSNCFTILGVGIDDYKFLINEFDIYPNPTKDVITINGAVNQNEVLRIYSMNGQLVYEQLINTLPETIDLSSFENGIYLVHYNSQYKKVILNKK